MATRDNEDRLKGDSKMGTMPKKYMKEWRDKHREQIREYNREAYHKPICDMNCFDCKFPDCRNNRAPTKAEREMMENAYGTNDPIRKAREEQERKRHRKFYLQWAYQNRKKLKSDKE